MATERQATPRSEIVDAPEGIEQAWIKLVDAKQEETYKKMSDADLKALREKMVRGEDLGEGLEEIADYVRAVDNYLSR